MMRYFPVSLDRASSDAHIGRMVGLFGRLGFGLRAREVAGTGEFIGFTGLNPMPDGVPGAVGMETGWRAPQSPGTPFAAGMPATIMASGQDSAGHGVGQRGLPERGPPAVISHSAGPSGQAERRVGWRALPVSPGPGLPVSGTRAPTGSALGTKAVTESAEAGEGRAMATRTADRPAVPPRPGDWRLAVALGPVVMGWMFGVGALASAIGVPVWVAAMLGLEVTVGATLVAFLVTRSAAMVAWWAGATACTTGWLTYVVAAGPWTWAGELSLVLPAVLLTLLWPLARAAERTRRGG